MKNGFCEEKEIIEALINSSETAFKVIYNRYNIRIYNLAMTYLNSPGLAQEAVQDTFMKLWAHRSSLKSEYPVEGWLITVSRNSILNTLKRLSIEWKALNYIKRNQIHEDNSLQDSIKGAEYQTVLKKALSTLSDKQLKVFTLARHENLTYCQIAEQLNISPLTVKTHMSRALGTIKGTITAALL